MICVLYDVYCFIQAQRTMFWGHWVQVEATEYLQHVSGRVDEKPGQDANSWPVVRSHWHIADVVAVEPSVLVSK